MYVSPKPFSKAYLPTNLKAGIHFWQSNKKVCKEKNIVVSKWHYYNTFWKIVKMIKGKNLDLLQ